MIENCLNKYINWVDSTGWKTFFKVYGLAVLYSLIMCMVKSDEWGLCTFLFPISPLDLFITPFLGLLGFLVALERKDDILISFYILIFCGMIINLYRFSKKESQFYLKAKKISQVVKLGLVSYSFAIFIFYVGVLISGYDCSYEVCGFLKGYR